MFLIPAIMVFMSLCVTAHCAKEKNWLAFCGWLCTTLMWIAFAVSRYHINIMSM